MMSQKQKITDELIQSCTYEAAQNTPGVSGLVRDVRIDRDKRGISLGVFIDVVYGARIPEVAWELQENIKHRVQDVAGIEINKINVTVQGVR